MRPAGSSITGSNILQTAVTVVVAVLVAAASFQASGASGDWDASVRMTIKRDAAILADVRRVYVTEATVGLEVALAEARADERNDAEGRAQRAVARSLRAGVGLVESDRYRLDGGGFDLGRRLAAVRRSTPDLVAIDPAARFREGDRTRNRAMLIALAVVPLLALYLVVELVLRRRQRHRNGSPPAANDVGLVPRPWSAPGGLRRGAIVTGIAWLMVTLLPVLAQHYDSRSSREGELASRAAIAASTGISARSFYNNVRFGGLKRATQLTTIGAAKIDAARDFSDLSQAAADTAASRRGTEIVTAMARLPDARSGVDAAALEALGAASEVTVATVAQQRHHSDRARDAGKRADRVQIALVLGALALSLTALAATGRGPRASVIDAIAASLLAGALLFAASALV